MTPALAFLMMRRWHNTERSLPRSGPKLRLNLPCEGGVTAKDLASMQSGNRVSHRLSSIARALPLILATTAHRSVTARVRWEVLMSITFIVVVVVQAVLALLIGYVNVKERLIENGDLER